MVTNPPHGVAGSAVDIQDNQCAGRVRSRTEPQTSRRVIKLNAFSSKVRKMTAAYSQKGPLDLRILYLEDEALVAMNYVSMLEEAGATVEDCATLGAAFSAL